MHWMLLSKQQCVNILCSTMWVTYLDLSECPDRSHTVVMICGVQGVERATIPHEPVAFCPGLCAASPVSSWTFRVGKELQRL